MDIVLKIFFFILSGINGSIGLIFFFSILIATVSRSAAQGSVSDRVVVTIGCLAIFSLLAWAFNLAIVQGRIGAGIGVAALSYLVWVLIQLTIIVIISIKGNWSWQ
jgi:hypothetical protein